MRGKWEKPLPDGPPEGRAEGRRVKRRSEGTDQEASAGSRNSSAHVVMSDQQVTEELPRAGAQAKAGAWLWVTVTLPDSRTPFPRICNPL